MEGVFSPSVPDSSQIYLGEGAIYSDYGEGSQLLLGATKDGSKYDEERVIRKIPYDGAYGATKELRRYERRVPRLTLNFLKISYANIQKGFPGMTITDVGDYKEITFDLEIQAADYLTNIAFVGQTHAGKTIIIKIFNPLNDGNVSLGYKEKDEVSSPMQYTGHYAQGTPTTCPVEISIYE